MSTDNRVVVSDPSGTIQHELAHLQKHWWYFLVLGCLLIIAGIVALAYPFVTSAAATIVIGAAIFVAGVAIVVSAFWTGSWSGFFLQILIGIMYTVVGVLILENPVETMAALTLLVAAMLIVVGIFRMVVAITTRFPQWGWVMLNGALALILGVLIYKNLNTSFIWLIGTILGIDLIFNGFTWIMLSIEVRNVKVDEATPE